MQSGIVGGSYRRVATALQRIGRTVNHKRVLRIRHADAVSCQLKRRWVPTTDSPQGLTTYPNLPLMTEVTTLNQVWVADIRHHDELPLNLEVVSFPKMP